MTNFIDKSRFISTPHNIQRLADEACTHPNTAKRWLKGKEMGTTTTSLLNLALKRLSEDPTFMKPPEKI